MAHLIIISYESYESFAKFSGADSCASAPTSAPENLLPKSMTDLPIGSDRSHDKWKGMQEGMREGIREGMREGMWEGMRERILSNFSKSDWLRQIT